MSTGKLDDRYRHDLEAKDVPGNLVRLGRTDGPARFLVWGDSHAMSILPGIESACADSEICAGRHAFRDTSDSGLCEFRCAQAAEARRIDRYNAAVMRYAQSGAVRAVILVGYWERYAKRDAARFGEAILKTVDRLQAAGLSVYFMRDVPAFRFDVPRALARCSETDQNFSKLGMMPAQYVAVNNFQASIVPKLVQRGVHS